MCCPDPNGIFGEDTDELEACEDCPLWDSCDDAKFAVVDALDQRRMDRLRERNG